MRRKKPKPSPPAECFIICHTCHRCVSNRDVVPVDVESMGTTVRTYVCRWHVENIERCADCGGAHPTKEC